MIVSSVVSPWVLYLLEIILLCAPHVIYRIVYILSNILHGSRGIIRKSDVRILRHQTRGVFRNQSNIYKTIYCENSDRRKVVNYFFQKAPSQMFDWVPNTPLQAGWFYQCQILMFRLDPGKKHYKYKHNFEICFISILSKENGKKISARFKMEILLRKQEAACRTEDLKDSY